MVMMVQVPAVMKRTRMSCIKRRGRPMLTKRNVTAFGLALLIFIPECASAAATSIEETKEPWLVPYTGPTRSDIDATTLDGRVLCGYQGWFNTPCDSELFDFGHWGQGLEDGNGRFTVDMW